MKQDWLKLLVATMLGASIGGILTQEFHAWFWWAGCLLGGLVGYLSYEWRMLVHSATNLFQEMTSRQAKILMKLAWWNFLFMTSLVTHIVIGIVLLEGLEGEQLGWVLFEFGLPVALSTGVTMSIFMTYQDRKISIDLRSPEFLERSLRAMRQSNLFIFPPFLYLWFLPKGIFKICAYGFPFLHRFLREVFVRIQSQGRLMAGMGAMAGATVSHFTQNNIPLGMLFGGLSGLLLKLILNTWRLAEGKRF